MKILELRFKNLNSLQGEWHIDFTDDAYQTHGIFALTGPTGAGKSTILDAICLALYGQTPRLGSITKTDNEIMSRHTFECYAEVRFLSQAGEFLCRFDQRRARKSITGALQDPRHEISDETGNILESKRSKVPAVVEEKTGMDFKRFTRSILLAQGQFDGFLKANSDEKSKILEQLTGTEIYAEISKSVFNRMREEEHAFDDLTASVEAVQLLTLEDEAMLQASMDDCAQKLTELKAEIAQTQAAMAWQKDRQALMQHISELQHEALCVSEQWSAFEPQQTRLNQALQAAALEGRLEHLHQLRKDHARDEEQLTQQAEALPLQKERCQQHQQKVDAATHALESLLAERADKEHLWEHVSALDQAMDAMRERIEQGTIKQSHDAAHLEDLTTQIEAIEARIAQIHQQCEMQRAYLQAHPKDGALIEVLPRICAIDDRLKQHDAKILALKNNYVEQMMALEHLQTQMTAQIAVKTESLAENSAAESEVTTKKAVLETLNNGQTLKDYQREKDHWLREQSFHATLHNYEAARARLKTDEPCPLCGSTAHPYVTAPLPTSEADAEVARITRIMDAIEMALVALEQAEKRAQDSMTAFKQAQAECEMMALKVSHAQSAVNESAAQIEALEQSVKADLNTWHAEVMHFDLTDLDRAAALTQLTERKAAWAAAEATIKAENEQLQPLQAELAALTGQKMACAAQLTAFEQELKAWQGQYDEKLKARQTLLGDAAVTAVKAEWQADLTARQTTLETVKTAHQQAAEAVMRLEERMIGLTASLQARAATLAIVNAEWTTACHEAGFASETAVLAAMLPKAERIALQTQRDALDAQVKENRMRLADAEARLIEINALSLTTDSMEVLILRFDEQQSHLDEVNQKFGSLQATWQQNSAAKSTMAQTHAAIEQQRLTRDQWRALNHLIGSADGKKYRTFAQGLTFELMVRQANQELMKMSDRYLLVRDEKEALQLNVIDNYQAGEVRSTKNLSGGESFIVSLALALGLSKMASRKVRVDSLFLDEGFGTLDEDALDTALSLLAGLHGEGKLIGIISHVSALKERITTQIQIQPKNGGKSIIIGPGCTKLDSSLMS
ncbi:Hypothetical protein F387_00963 [Wohlfahrtiimonas chitiniclastica SH04]|uniref:Rad50/SbcC-type AAA domain-containing protein n=1 Tax=Wohlfahrtiimonas chitiniclastica SH04 TaxID=1261130 RepID=L8Y3V7_9GAMM|nr:AAA family ATPase [Wohlfahrtiimonas chitiniclastica]ELV09071.1 Hypothetical protein F387_00963 [Wohlfahrtiimonas chitiniclastica SH04]